MTEPTTPDLAAIRARAAAATPGPWQTAEQAGYPEYGENFVGNFTGEYLAGVGDIDFGAGDDAEADLAFVLNAPEDVSALLALVDRQAAEVVRLRARVAELEAAAEQDDDEMVRCAALHCPNGEWFAKAAARGWAPGHMGTWLCPQHRPAEDAPSA